MAVPSSDMSTSSSSSSSSLSSSSSQEGARHERKNSERLRMDLIMKLGLENSKNMHHLNLPEQCNREPYTRSLLGKVNMHKEQLKYKQDEDVICKSEEGIWGGLGSFFKKSTTAGGTPPAPSSSSVSSSSSFSASEYSTSTTSRKRPPVSFNEEVSVCPIPMKDEYSKRIKDRIWASQEELMLNAHRNTVEFAAENWDWRQTPDDEQMYRCLATNELIHPVHIESQHAEELLGGHAGMIQPQQEPE
jgi:hypothetical protein